MKTLFILCLTLCSLVSFSQKQDRYEVHKWKIDSSLNLSDSTAVAGLIGGNNKGGIAFLDENGNVSAELSIPGRIIGLSKWKGNIVGFYVDQWDARKVTQNIHAVLIDVRTKAIKQDQPIFTNPDKHYIVNQVMNDDRGNFGSLLIRTSKQKGGYSPGFGTRAEPYSETAALTALYLSDNLQPVTRPLSSAAIGTAYLAAYANRNGDLAILSYGENQIVAEKFGSDGQLQKKATVSFPGFNPWGIAVNGWTRGAFRPASNDILAFSVVKGVFVFDFGSGKAWSLETAGSNDKAYNDHVDQDPEVKKAKNFKYTGDFKPDCLFFDGDTLICSKEIEYSEQPLQYRRYIGAGTMVTVYDGQFRWLHNFYLDRYFESFTDDGYHWSYKVQNGRILAFANAVAHVEKYENICYVADLHTYQLEQKILDWGDVPHVIFSDAQNVFWFRNNLLKNPYTASETRKRVESYLVRMQYP